MLVYTTSPLASRRRSSMRRRFVRKHESGPDNSAKRTAAARRVISPPASRPAPGSTATSVYPNQSLGGRCQFDATPLTLHPSTFHQYDKHDVSLFALLQTLSAHAVDFGCCWRQRFYAAEGPENAGYFRPLAASVSRRSPVSQRRRRRHGDDRAIVRWAWAGLAGWN